MADMMIADQRWSPKVICDQTAILSFSKFSQFSDVSLNIHAW